MPTATRRSILSGVLGTAALSLAGCGTAAGVDERSGTLRSRHWPGQDIGWRLAIPTARHPTRTPVVIALHGKGGNAGDAFRSLHLDDHVQRAGVTVASVDGGDYYWHHRRSGIGCRLRGP